MDASIVFWEQWHDQVKQFFEGMHGHQKRGFALTVIGILLAGSAVLQRMAESVHLASISEAKMRSHERRFARFVANERLVVKNVWKQFLAQVLPYWHGKRIHLILDCTPCGEKAISVYLGFLAHSRALPLAWRVMPLQESWDEKQWKLVGAMFDEVQAQLVSADCTLIADRGRETVHPSSSCAAIASGITCYASAKSIPCGVSAASTSASGWPVESWFTGRDSSGSDVCCVGSRRRSTRNSRAVWDADQREAWFLISDQPAGRRRVQEYALRMRVESTGQRCQKPWLGSGSQLDCRS